MAEPLGVPLPDGLPDPLGVPLGLGVEETDGLAVGERVPLAVPEPVEERVPVAVGDPLPVPDTEADCVGDCVTDWVGVGEQACLRPLSCMPGHLASGIHKVPPLVETSGAPGMPVPRPGIDTPLGTMTSYQDTEALAEIEMRCACDTMVSAMNVGGRMTLMYCSEERGG